MTIEEVKALIENKKYVDYIKSDEDIPLLLKLLEANCNNEEIKFVLDNTDIFEWTADADYSIKRELIQICMNIGAKTIRSCAGLSCGTYRDRRINICGDYMYTRQIIEQYNYAESVFKNKPKCFAFSALDHSAEYLHIPNDLVVYFDNFDDDSLYEVLKRVWAYGNNYIKFALKLSTLTTNYNETLNLYKELFIIAGDEEDRFADDIYERVNAGAITADVIIKFCKMKKIDIPDFVKDALPEYIESIDDIIERLVDYFESSKRFALKYDDETIYIIAVLRNNAPRSNHMIIMEDDSIRKGCRIITFHKEDDDNYEYIFKIDHEDDERLTYSAKITTEKDVIDCINKSIDLIEGIDEYSVIVEELQEVLEYLTT